MSSFAGPFERWRRRIGGCLALAALAAAAGPGWADGAPSVAALELRSDLPAVAVEPMKALILLKVGEPLSEERIRRTLRNLQASGKVARAAVYSEADPESPLQRRVVVAFWSSRIVEEVLLVGDLGLAERSLRTVLPQRPGLPLVEDRVLRGLYGLQDLYQRSGFFAAQVRLRVSAAAVGSKVRVAYHVEAGPRWSVGSIGFEGDLGTFGPSGLLEPLEVRSGDPYDARKLEEDPERLQRWLGGAGFRKARVFAARQARRDDARSVDVTFEIVLGPSVEARVQGAEMERLRKKGLLSFLDEEGYDSALLIREKSRLKAHFQAQGYYEARVDLREEDLGDRILVHVDIEPGEPFSLTEVRFEGNEAYSERQLSELISSQPRQRFRPGSGRLVDETLQEDLENLRSFYALQGFFKARLEEPRVERDGQQLRLVFAVDEGPQRRVVTLDGLVDADGDALVVTTLQEGGAFHPRRLEEAVEDLRSQLRAAGYDQARVRAEEAWIGDQLVDISFRIQRGPRTRVERVIIRGNVRTRSEVVRRAAGLSAGQPISRSRLLEVERALSRLGIFSRVDVRLSPGEIGQVGRDVIVEVEEGRARRVSYGWGYDSEDGTRGLLGFSHQNLLGRALSLRWDARVSEKDERFRLVLDQPFLGPWDIPMTYSLFEFNEDRESFQQRSSGLRVDARRDFPWGRWGLSYDFRLIELQEVEEPIENIDPQDREVEVSSLIPSLVLDRRDDPFDPTEGWSSSFQLQYAFPALATDTHFLKLFVQQTGYLSLGRPGVLAASLRLGAIEPFDGGLSQQGDLETAGENPVPIGERFFAGGRTSHRGYERDLLGITGETRIADVDPLTGAVDLLPVGGNGLLLANLEYRFPVLGSLGGTLFLDVGNVWRDWRDFDFDDLRYGAGLGVRYRSPIGPVRLEFGWNLESEAGEDSAEIHLTFGNPF